MSASVDFFAARLTIIIVLNCSVIGDVRRYSTEYSGKNGSLSSDNSAILHTSLLWNDFRKLHYIEIKLI